MIQVLRDELVSSIQGVAMGVGAFVPKLFFAVVLVALGFIFGAAVGRVVTQLVNTLKLDDLLAKAGVSAFFTKAGYPLNSGAFFGWLARLFFVVVFMVAAFDVLELTAVNEFLKTVLLYIPQVVVAALMLFFASIVADFLSNVVSGMSKGVGTHVANLLGTITRTAIWVFAVIVALSHLGIAPQFMQLLFTGFVAMVAIAGGLAFGLGGKDAAADLIKKIREDVRSGR